MPDKKQLALPFSNLFVTIVTMPKASPTCVTVGSVKLPIYTTPSGSRTRYTLVWYDGGVRRRKVFDDLDAAKAHAQEVGAGIANGELAVATMRPADRDSYVTAVRELAPTGVPLLDAVRQYVAAMAVLPPGTSLLEAASAYAQRSAGAAGRKPLPELVEEFVKKERLSERYVETIRAHLRRLAKRFVTGIGNVRAKDLRAWLNDITESPKSFNNYRGSIVTFFKWAKEQGHLSSEVITEAEKTSRLDEDDADVAIFTPDEMKKLLERADDEMRLYLVLAGFAGIRREELMRMHWRHIDFKLWRFKLDKSVTKTGAKRNFAIVLSLRAWLEHLQVTKRTGKIFEDEELPERVIAFAREIGVEWKQNVLRHSALTYRTAQTKNQPQVALEAGNSVAMVRKHYDDVAGEEEAQAWFGILPGKTSPAVSV